MKDYGSYKGVSSTSKTVLRDTPRQTQDSVQQERKSTSTYSPRGHA